MDNTNFSFKKRVSRLCFLLIIGHIMSILVMYIGVVFGVLSLNNRLTTYGWDMILSFVRAVPFVIFAKKHNIFSGSNKKEKQSFKISASMVFLGLLIAIAANLLTNLVEYIFSSCFNFELPTFKAEGSKNILEFIVDTITIAIMPALIEEFVYRGVILNSLNRYNSKAAIVISAIVFALDHGNVPQFIFALIPGLYLGFLFVKTGSLKICMLTHFSVNFFNVMMRSILVHKENQLYVILYWLIMLFVVLIGVLSLITLIRKKRLSAKWLDQNSLISTKKCYALASLNLGAIIFILFMLFVFVHRFF